jgi:hypothetical protein
MRQASYTASIVGSTRRLVMPGGSLLVEDRSFTDNHRLATDPNFLENSCTA